ncbi:uncharacterized protein LOC101745833 isoform X1 [Bombyx mori]|uniref:Uncharacterized protein n=1 Tax=Bombyx mori TaxID=7091 RepID=A0A8R2LTJ8_BOMMO|nr:uncharacterized protein LOC101745833 isoform X1 [Bombyx mori]
MDLKTLANEIEDVLDPASMDKVLMYYKDVQEEDEEFMQILFENLRNETVYWLQPWYQLSGCLTRRLDETDEKNEEKYRSDPICKEEDEKIKKNWRKLIKKYGLPDKLISFARWKNKERSKNPNSNEERVRRFVASYLARGLERTVQQVFKYIISHLIEPSKRHYTAEEEKIMEVCFTHQPHNAVIYLSAILGREPRGIYKRLHYLFKGCKETKRLKWTIPLATKLVKSIMMHTGLPLEELKYQTFDKSVWLKVQEDMNQNYIALSKFWYTYLHVQIFANYDVKLNKLKKKVYRVLRESHYQVWTDIRWKDVLKHFPDGFTHLFLYKICSTTFVKHPNYLKIPIEKIIEIGLKKAKMIRFNNRRLKTLKLGDDGNLERVSYHLTKKKE